MRPGSHSWPFALIAVARLSLACQSGRGDEPLKAYGSIEAREVDISSRNGGRVQEVLVEEDDAVSSGQPLARLEVSELEAQRSQAKAALAAADAQLRLLEQGARKEDIAIARRSLDAARVRAEAAQRDFERAQRLFEGRALPRQSLENAREGRDLAQAELASRRAQLEKIVGGARAEEIAAATAARDQAQGALSAVEDRLRDRELEAPLDAFVLHRLVEPGEVVRPAQPLLVLGDLAHPYLDVYVPERRMGEARQGASALVRVDAYPGRTFRARVRHVSQVAEFTPKNVQTADERARLVFRVRLDVDDPEGLLRPGMPGEAEFGTAADSGIPRER